MTRHRHHAMVKSPWLCHRQHDSAAPSLAWLGIDIAPRSTSPRQRHHQHDLITPSLAWLDIYIAPWLSLLGSAIASMTRWRHCATANVASAAPSPAWLDSIIISRSRHRHRVVAKTHQQHCRQHEPRRHDSATTSRHCQYWLDSIITSMTRGLDTYFPDHPSDSEVHYRSGSGLEEYYSNWQLDLGTRLLTDHQF
jgi:hypothetical protein